jgi:signal transduction histidine kinase
MQLPQDYWKTLLPAALTLIIGLAGVTLLQDPGAAIWVEIFLLLAVAGVGIYAFMQHANRFARVDALRQGLLRYKAGDYSSRIEDGKFDDLGEVVRLTNELAANLQKMQGTMTQVERQRQQMFTDLTQTIAKPLAGLRSALDGVLRDTNGQPVPDREQRLTSILEEIHHLGALVDDLIEVSNIDGRRFRLNLKQVDVPALLRQAQKRFEVALQRKNMRCDVDIPNNFSMRGDPDRLGHVFHSLFANSIKYAGENTTIRVSAARQGNILRLHFDDDGVGMSQEVLKKVFRRFERGETAEVMGAGLGLSVCKYIVNQHRGRMRIDSAPKKGTKVLLEFMPGGGAPPGHRRRRRPSGRRTG